MLLVGDHMAVHPEHILAAEPLSREGVVQPAHAEVVVEVALFRSDNDAAVASAVDVVLVWDGFTNLSTYRTGQPFKYEQLWELANSKLEKSMS